MTSSEVRAAARFDGGRNLPPDQPVAVHWIAEAETGVVSPPEADMLSSKVAAAAAIAFGHLALAGPADARTYRSTEAASPLRGAGPVTVDVSRLRALGLGPTADVVGAAVADELRSRPVTASGRLVVRIDALSLSSYSGPDGGGDSGGGGGGGSGGVNFDYMQGEALVVGPRGEILQRLPIVMSLPSSSGGAYYLPDVDQRRVIELSRNFARWVERGLS